MTVIEQHYMEVVVKYLPRLVQELEKRDALLERCLEQRAKEKSQKEDPDGTVK